MIQRIFRDRAPTAFKDELLADHFPLVFRQYGGETNLASLITALVQYHYKEDGQEILDKLVEYAGQEAFDAALADIRPPPKLDNLRVVPLTRERGEALGYMRNAHALVIGIGHYQHLKSLDNTLNDARDVAATLTNADMCGYPPAQVKLLLDSEATKSRISEELRALAKRTNPDSTVFIFAACHGGRIESGEFAGYYLLPVEARGRKKFGDRDYADSAISEQAFSQLLGAIPSRKMFIVLDCCYAGGVANFRSDEEVQDEQNVDKEEGLAAELRRETLNQLASSGRGRVILAAANRQQTAKELVSDRNGLFTKYVIAGLQGAGKGAGPFVDVFELYRYVHDGVSRTNVDQTPVYKADLEAPDLPIAVRAVQYFPAK